MGFPPQLDGLPSSLKLHFPVRCPECGKVNEVLKVKREGDRFFTICPRCKEQIDVTEKVKSAKK